MTSVTEAKRKETPDGRGLCLEYEWNLSNPLQSLARRFLLTSKHHNFIYFNAMFDIIYIFINMSLFVLLLIFAQ